MKAKHLFIYLTLTIFALSLSTVGNAQSGAPKKANEAEVTFSVEIDCPSCQKKIESRLPFERGVKDMKISMEKQEIWILYQTDRTDKKKLIEALKKLGHEAKEKVTEKESPEKSPE